MEDLVLDAPQIKIKSLPNLIHILHNQLYPAAY